jgi:hypothetical protein
MVTFACECGRQLRSRKEYAGQYTVCPACGAEAVIPEEDSDRPAATGQSQKAVDTRMKTGRTSTGEEEQPTVTYRPGTRERGRGAADRRPGRSVPAPAGGRSLWPWVAGALALLVLASGGVALWYFVLRDSTPAHDKKALLTNLDLVPDEAAGFATVRFGHWWNGPAGKKVRQQLASLDPDRMVEKTLGVPPADVERVTVVVLWPKEVYAVVSTTKPVDQAKVRTNFLPTSTQKSEGGKTYWAATSGPLAVHFPGDRLFVVGFTPNALPEFFKKAVTGKAGKTWEEARGLADKHLVVASVRHALKDFLLMAGAEKEPPPEVRPYLALLEAPALTFTGDLGDDLNLSLRLKYPDAAKARQGEKAARQLLQEARRQLAREKSKVRSGQMGEVVASTFNLFEALIRTVKVDRKELVVRLGLETETSSLAGPVGQLVGAVEKVRGAANRTMSQNNLRQIALAMQNFHDTFRGLPLPAAGPNPFDGKPLLSWRVHLLPFLEQVELYKKFHLNEPWNSEHNKKLLPLMPKVYEPVGGVKTKEPYSTFYQVFTGPQTPFFGTRRFGFANFTDGTSNTFLVVEAKEAVPWTKPDDLPYQPDKPLPKLGGLFPEGFNAALADASVRWIPRRTSEKTIRAAITPQGGETIQWDE